MTNDVRTPHKNRRKSMFPGDFWSLGEPWETFGWFLGPFGPKSVFRTGEHGSLDPLWAPLADPKIGRKSLKVIHVGIVVQKKMCPKTGPPARSLFIKVSCNSDDPGTLFCELSPAREHDSQKKTRSLKVPKKHPKVVPNGSPKLPILSPRVKRCHFVVNKMQSQKYNKQIVPKSYASSCK